MARKGLNKEAVVLAAVHLIEEKGYASFSMRELAMMLGVKTASLYNHVESMDELFVEVGLTAVSMMIAYENESISGKNQNDALFALADAYRRFAKEHYELYKIIMSLQKTQNAVLEQAAGRITEPIMRVLSGYDMDERLKMHWQRILRSMMHGFVAHEQSGGFSHFPIDKDESYHLAIQVIADSIEKAGKGHNENR